MGDWLGLNLQPVKFNYLQENFGCRKKPYVEELVSQVEAGISEKYGKLCRPRNIFWDCLALAQSVEVKQLRVCYSESEEQQLMDVLSRAQKNITEQPCLKLTYDLKLQGPWSTNPNHTVFGVALTSPYETIVNEVHHI